MKLNARGEVTQKYRKAALLDRELERGNEEEKNLQADAVAHEARVAAAARTAGRRRRLVGDDLRRVTLAFDGRAAGAPTAALGAAFELTLPKSWDDRPCSKLLKHFAKTYAVKYPSEPPLRVKGLELLRNDGAAVALDALIGDEVGGRGAPEELVVAFTAAGGSAANAPVVLVLGEVETYAGLAGEHEPKFVTPSFVKAVWLEDGSSQPSGFAAGGRAAARPGAKTLADPCRAHALLLAKKELCFARSLVEDAPETIRGRVPLPDGADAAVSEECYLATELLFARQDECPLPALAAAPPLHICAADAIKRVGDRRLHRPLLAGVIVTGCDDACHEGCDVRVAQELGNLLRGTWVVSRSDYDAMVAARGVYAKDGSGDDGGGDDVVPMKRASGAVGPPGVDEIVEEHALTDTRAALDAKSLPRCEIARAE
ncbi:symporter [Aureococcus anophagefferens]|nr:symporter [Aureococcus anophagefferens]